MELVQALVVYVIMANAPWTTFQAAGPFSAPTDAEALALCQQELQVQQERGIWFHSYRCVKISGAYTPPAKAS